MSTNPFVEAIEQTAAEDRRAREERVAEERKVAARAKSEREHDIEHDGYAYKDCYCLASNGFPHHERDFPWVSSYNPDEPTPEPPYLDANEEPHERDLRVAKAEAWNQGAEATVEWMANNPSPSGIPHDPPRNPYQDEQGQGS